MTLKLYTLRGRHSGRLYYATGFNMLQAAREIKISPRDLILERSEVIPVQTKMREDGVQINQPVADKRGA